MHIFKCNDLLSPQNDDDCKKVLKIYNESFPTHLKISDRRLKRRINRVYTSFLIRVNEQTIGFALLWIPKTRFVHIDYLAIDQAHRKNGTGSAALKMLIEQFKDRIVTLECEDRLVGFYSRFGFKVSRIGYCDHPKLNFMTIGSGMSEIDLVNKVSFFNGFTTAATSERKTFDVEVDCKVTSILSVYRQRLLDHILSYHLNLKLTRQTTVRDDFDHESTPNLRRDQ